MLRGDWAQPFVAPTPENHVLNQRHQRASSRWFFTSTEGALALVRLDRAAAKASSRAHSQAVVALHFYFCCQCCPGSILCSISHPTGMVRWHRPTLVATDASSGLPPQ